MGANQPKKPSVLRSAKFQALLPASDTIVSTLNNDFRGPKIPKGYGE